MFISTLSLFNAIKTDLAARHYSQPAPDQAAVLSTSLSDPSLFEQVDFWRDKNLENAMQILKVTRNRIALFVPLGDDYTNIKGGTAILSQRKTQFMLMMADKNLSIDAGRMLATRNTPGILAMKDLAVEALTQKSYKIAGVNLAIVPTVGAVMQLEYEKDATPATIGRECWNQIFEVEAGARHISFART